MWQDQTGSILITASRDKSVKLWNWRSGKFLYTLDEHENTPVSIQIYKHFLLIAGQRDWHDRDSDDMSTLRVWDMKKRKQIRSMKTSTNNNYILSIDHQNVRTCGTKEYVGNDYSIYSLDEWDWTKGQHLRTKQFQAQTVGDVTWCGNLLFYAQDAIVNIVNWKTGQHYTSFTTDAPTIWVKPVPDYSRIIAGDSNGRVHFLRPNAALLKLLRGEDS